MDDNDGEGTRSVHSVRLQSAPDLHLRIEDQQSPASIRRALRDLIGTAAPTVAGQSAQLVCSELVNNVVGHTVGGGWMSAWWIPDRLLRLEVLDTDPSMPSLPSVPAASQLHGRGLHIVDTIATRWGMTRSASGKSVWCEIDWPSPA